MRISILTATSGWGGAEHHAVSLAKNLRKKGNDVAIVELGHSVYDDHLDQLGGVDVIRVQLSRPLESLRFSESFRLQKGLRSEIGVFEKGELDSGNVGFDLAARLCFKRYISIEQLICNEMPAKIRARWFGGILPRLSLWWHRIYWQRCARSLGPHSVVCVSEAVRSRLVESYKFRPQKTITIHNGIDASRFRFDPILRATTRRAWGIPTQDLVFGAVGRLAPVKAYNVAIAAFKELRSSIRERRLWLVLVGDGPSRQELVQLVKDNRLQDWVKFPGPTERPWEIYPAFDVFIMPSLLEGLPHALLEAMASECPPIASEVGGIPEIITNPNMGWLIPKGGRDGFLAAMAEAIRCPAQRLSEMGERARERVMSHFDSDVLLDRLANLIEFGPESCANSSDASAGNAKGVER
jgi:glycosyltransferase involved in cell wall biosynthesis